jgi:hypothetical protein
MGTLKSIGTAVLGLLILAALLFLAVLLILGAGWVSEKLLPWFSFVSIIAFVVLVVILLPLSGFRRTRSFAATSILIVSYLFGATVWMEGLMVTLAFWGATGVIIGLCFAGVGVVPVGMLAALLHGKWATLFELFQLKQFLSSYIQASETRVR